MSEDTLTQIRTEGEELLSLLERYYYSNFTGLSNKPGAEEIFSSFREFGDQELYFSIRDKLSEAETKDKGLILLREFLADMFVQSRSSHITDKILSLEARLKLKVDDKKIPYRSACAQVLTDPKKKIRDEINSSKEIALKELSPLWMERRYLILEALEELGMNSDLSGLESLSEQAKSFLKDTDYISSEMLEWFFLNQMELPLKDASSYDLYYLINSYELAAAFPLDKYEIPAGRVLDDSGLVNSSEVNAESGIRAGKLPGSFLFLTSPPAEMAVSVCPLGGPKDYEDYLSALGSALSFVFTDRDEDFEFRFLRDPSQTELFSALFKNLIYEHKWLDRYIDYERGKDLYKLLFLRRLMNVREAAANVIYESSLSSEQNEEALRDIYKELMESALHTQVSGWSYLNPGDIRKNLNSARVFKSLITEPSLSKYLKESFDEEWWRVRGAGSELKRIWSEGGRVFTSDVEELTGFDGTSAELRSLFERELG